MSISDKFYENLGLSHAQPQLGPLRRRFLYPPYSVWNTRDGFWRGRRNHWIALGIQSELGRGENLLQLSEECEEFRQGKGDYTRRTIRDKAIEPGGGGGPNSAYIRSGQTKRAKGKVYHDHDWMREKLGYEPAEGSGTSIFDPVLTELCYSWWCKPGGVILDPFCGGSVRGIVASVLGYKYWGCDLRQEQIEANHSQLNEVTRGRYRPKWICGDSRETLDEAPEADMVFSCPPYGDLEVYSDDPRDISTMRYEDFLHVLGEIVGKACGKLRDNRFAAFVVANFRARADDRVGASKRGGHRDTLKTRPGWGSAAGHMRNFVGDTIDLFGAAGLRFYNDIVLVNAVGSGAIRANNTFARGGGKMVKLHQNVLVFCKGDPKLATAEIPTATKTEDGEDDAD